MNHHCMSEAQKKLLDACASGNKAEIFKLTSEGCDVVQLHNECGQTPLHIACQYGQFDIVRLLIEVYGVHPNIRDNRGCKPLHEACLAGNLNVVAYMLNVPSEGDLDFTEADTYGDTILHKVCRSGSVAVTRYIVEKVTIPTHSKLNLYQDDTEMYNRTHRKYVCKHCNKRHSKFHPLRSHVYEEYEMRFFEYTRQIQMCFKKSNSYGDTPIHTACRYGFLDIIKYFIDEIGFSTDLNSLLHVACLTGRGDVTDYLLKWESDCQVPCDYALSEEQLVLSHSVYRHRPTRGLKYDKSSVTLAVQHTKTTLLHTACQCGNLSLVRTLFTEYNYSQVTRNSIGDTPLHCACVSDVVDIVDLLVAQCSELHSCQNVKGNTPLHIACEWGAFNAANTLLTVLNLDINARNKSGETPLHLACKYGRLDICKLLLANDHCDVTIQTSKTKETPLHVACYGTAPELVKCLLEKSTSKQDMPDVYGDTPLFNACRSGKVHIVRLLTGKYCNPLYINTQTHETPIHIACRKQQVDIVRVLLDGHTSQINQQNLHGKTLLHLACQSDAVEIMKLLVQHNYCDPNIRDQFGETPLYIACKSQQIGIVKCLIDSTCNFNQTNGEENNTALHIACSKPSLKIVKLLMGHCKVSIQNKDGDTPIHTACKGCRYENLKCLLEGQMKKLDHLKNNAGLTPLHCACFCSALNIVQLLVQKQYCDPTQTDLEGNTALHIACKVGNAQMAEYLITTGKCDLKKQNKVGYPPLFCALEHNHSELIIHLVTRECIDLRDSDHTFKTKGECFPLLHFAYKQLHPEFSRSTSFFKFLISHGCDINQQDMRGNTLLHLVCERMDLKMMILLMRSENCDPNYSNSDGATPLHIACCSRLEIVKALLDSGKIKDISPRNEGGKTPIQLAHDYRIVRLLIGHGADPQDVYEHYGRILEWYKDKEPLHPFMKVFVLGNSTAGKSTLVEALKTEALHPTSLVSNVEGPTAGVVKIECSSKVFGKVLFHDFAGQPEFESSHSAFLESSLTPSPSSSPPIFFLVVNVKNTNQQVTQHVQYWLSFIENYCGCTEVKPHAIVIGSHADLLSPSEQSFSLSLLKKTLDVSKQSVLKYFGPLLLDCRKPGSVKMESLRTLLKDSCSSLRRCVELDSRCHVLFAYLHENFSKDPAITVGKLQRMIRGSRHARSPGMNLSRYREVQRLVGERKWMQCSEAIEMIEDSMLPPNEKRLKIAEVLATVNEPSHRYSQKMIRFPPRSRMSAPEPDFDSILHRIQYSEHLEENVGVPLPFVDEELIRLLDDLHHRGHLLLLKGASELKNYWIVLDQDTLLHAVNGTIFAPQDFEQHLTLETNTGVVPSSKLDGLFPDLDPDMVKQFLVYSELCQKIEDNETLKLIQGNEDSYVDIDQSLGTPMESHNCFCFFPGLIRAERPPNVWNKSDFEVWSYCCGWLIRCKPQQFLTTRFLHVLLLRLVFNYAAVIDEDSSTSALKRRCDIWKNGIQWCSRCGVEVLVEVIEQNSVVLVLMRCFQGQEMECVKLRSDIIGKILVAKEKFCPRVEINEYFIDNSDLANYPNMDITAPIEMREVTKTICDATPCILYHQSKMVPLDRLLYFEPYSTLGKSLLISLFDPENSCKKIPTEVLLKISHLRHRALQYFVCMLQVPNEELLMHQETWRDHPSFILHHILEYWQDTKSNGGTYQELREEFDKYSIFCGRNPLNVCTQENIEAAKGTPCVQ